MKTAISTTWVFNPAGGDLATSAAQGQPAISTDLTKVRLHQVDLRCEVAGLTGGCGWSIN